MFRLKFTTHILGKGAAEKLRRHSLTQTIRSQTGEVVQRMASGQLLRGDQLEVALDDEVVGHAYIFSNEPVMWDDLTIQDARRGGFESLGGLRSALVKAGYRFQPLEKYKLHRIQFSWWSIDNDKESG